MKTKKHITNHLRTNIFRVKNDENVASILSYHDSPLPDMKRRFITDESDYGELDTGETVLAFASHELGKSNFSGGYVSATNSKEPLGIEIVLVTDDVNTTHKSALKFGATELKTPEIKPWGQMVSYVRCPSGILLELCTPVEQ